MTKFIDIPKEAALNISLEDQRQLKRYEVIADDKYAIELSENIKPKECYVEAFRFLADSDYPADMTLVHGKYKPSIINLYAGHAWVVINENIVFDGVLQAFYKKDKYYEFYEIIEDNRYTKSEMFHKGLENGGHYGPWL